MKWAKRWSNLAPTLPACLHHQFHPTSLSSRPIFINSPVADARCCHYSRDGCIVNYESQRLFRPRYRIYSNHLAYAKPHALRFLTTSASHHTATPSITVVEGLVLGTRIGPTLIPLRVQYRSHGQSLIRIGCN